MNWFCKWQIVLSSLFTITSASLAGQNYLQQRVTITKGDLTVRELLLAISQQVHCRFAYNSQTIPEDSLVHVNVLNKPLKELLNNVFGSNVHCKQRDEYIIIQRTLEDGQWYVSGYVNDESSGEPLRDVSVYQPQQLVATLTNDVGFFRLRLRSSYAGLPLVISKMSYRDTTLILNPAISEVAVSILPKDYSLDSFVFNPRNRINKTWYGRLFFSSKQRIQGLNLSKFFVSQPYQLSLLPSIGTHGRLSPQVGNKVSINMLGGYNASLNGVEFGGLFNIIRKDMKYAQFAGLFNVVGGHSRGLQAAGIYNQAFDTVIGVQAAGIANLGGRYLQGLQASGILGLLRGSVRGCQTAGIVAISGGAVHGAQTAGVLSVCKKQVRGLQIAGVTSFSADSIVGCQVAGLVTVARSSVRGSQVAGLCNTTAGDVRGWQIAGLLNVATCVHGSQVGIINISDTIAGYSFGLFNFIRKGKHQIGIGPTELFPVAASARLGTQKLYTVWAAGVAPRSDEQAYGFGWGLGKAWQVTPLISLYTEASLQQVYLGSWDRLSHLYRLQAFVHYKLSKLLGAYLGPAYCVFDFNQRTPERGFKALTPNKNIGAHSFGEDVWGWTGWHLGITLF